MSTQVRTLHKQFDDIDQQRDSNMTGMWVFLVTETMLFGGLFLAYALYRNADSAAFESASAATQFGIGTTNTAVLLCSSLTMALGVNAIRAGRQRTVIAMLTLTAILGTVFLVLKGVEYYRDYTSHEVPGNSFIWTGVSPAHVQMFFMIYFIMTGLHSLHMTIGIGVVLTILYMTCRGRFSSENDSPIEITGLYWHFVDVVWVFLYPMFYLSGRHG